MSIKAIVGFVIVLLMTGGFSTAHAFETRARNALVMDVDTGTVLYAKGVDKPIPPASMSKLMTIYMAFDAIKSGRLSLDDTFLVSEKAWRTGGSKMFVRVGDKITIKDLLYGIIVQSGNDACVVIAEGLAGTEEAFAARMTDKAKEIGLENSVFANSTGLPADGHRMSLMDLAKLSKMLMADYPDLYKIFAETRFEWEGITQNNRNPLLYANLGADGLKTGHTEEAGYGLVGSAVQDGRRILIAVAGLDSQNEREQESQRLISWGFREFRNVSLFDANEPLADVPVWMGENRTVGLVLEKPFSVSVPVVGSDQTKVRVKVNSPLNAPLKKGEKAGELIVVTGDMPAVRVPLVVAKDVAEGGILVKMRTVLGKWLDINIGLPSASDLLPEGIKSK